MLNRIGFYLMLVGYGILAVTSLGWKQKVMGVLLWVVNFLIFN